MCIRDREWELLEREPHMKMKDYVKDLNHLYKNEKALHEIDNTYEGFDFIDPHNSCLLYTSRCV